MLRQGLGYLARDLEDIAVPLTESLAAAGTPFLWLTSRSVDSAPDGGDLLRVTTVRGTVATADPRRLPDLRTAATTFFDERGPGVLVLDCLESLIVHSGLERALRFVDDLHEETALRNGILIVLVDPRSVSPRMIARLERELDPFPEGASPPRVEDRLVV